MGKHPVLGNGQYDAEGHSIAYNGSFGGMFIVEGGGGSRKDMAWFLRDIGDDGIFRIATIDDDTNTDLMTIEQNGTVNAQFIQNAMQSPNGFEKAADGEPPQVAQSPLRHRGHRGGNAAGAQQVEQTGGRSGRAAGPRPGNAHPTTYGNTNTSCILGNL